MYFKKLQVCLYQVHCFFPPHLLILLFLVHDIRFDLFLPAVMVIMASCHPVLWPQPCIMAMSKKKKKAPKWLRAPYLSALPQIWNNGSYTICSWQYVQQGAIWGAISLTTFTAKKTKNKRTKTPVKYHYAAWHCWQTKTFCLFEKCSWTNPDKETQHLCLCKCYR